MPAQDTAEIKEQVPVEGAKGGIQDVMIRMALGVVVNLIARKVKQRQARKKAARKVEKLARKGKKIPSGLQKDMVKGLGRRARRKVTEKAEREGITMSKKKAEKKAENGEEAKKKGKIGKLLRLVILVVAVVLVVRLVKGQQVEA